MTDPNFIDPAGYLGLVEVRDTERAWAAGFFDGEGYFGFASGKYLRLTVVQTELTTLYRFQAATGGHGNIYQRSANQPANWVRGWCLQLGAHGDITHAVNLLWEFLSEPKRAQISAAYDKRDAYRSSWSKQFPTPQQRLSDAGVRAIRAALENGGRTQRSIATEFGVSDSLISKIKLGKKKTGVA